MVSGLLILAVLSPAALILILSSGNVSLTFGVTAAVAVVVYLILKPSYTRAFYLMIVTLPFIAGFVIDIGGNLRVPYYFAIIALLLGFHQRQIRSPRVSLPILVLGAFALYAFMSTTLILKSDLSREFVDFGFRTSKFRLLIQAGQLSLMLAFFYLTLNYISSELRLRRVSQLIFLSLLVVMLYAAYELLSALLNIPFLNINSNPDYVEGRFAGTQLALAGDIYIPRPRSILLEPVQVAAYTLFTLPFAIAVVGITKNNVVRWIILGCILLAIVVFVLTWSRAGFATALVVLPLSFLLLRTGLGKFRLLLGVFLGYLIVAMVIFPILGADLSITTPGSLIYDRVSDVTLVPDAYAADRDAISQIGRDYSVHLEIFKTDPVTGVGLGNYFFALADLRDNPIAVTGTASLFLEILTRFGVIGTSLFVFFVGLVLWRIGRVISDHRDSSLRPFAVASFISITGMMVHGIGAGTGLTSNAYMWVLLAIGVAIPQIASRSKIGPGPQDGVLSNYAAFPDADHKPGTRS